MEFREERFTTMAGDFTIEYPSEKQTAPEPIADTDTERSESHDILKTDQRSKGRGLR